MIRLALDGLWMADLFGLASPQGALRDQVFATLERVAERRTQRGHQVRVGRKIAALSMEVAFFDSWRSCWRSPGTTMLKLSDGFSKCCRAWR